MATAGSGRVAVYQEWNGTRIAIRASRGLMLVFFFIWLAIWITVPSQLVLTTLRGFGHPATVPGFGVLWTIGWFGGICFVLSQILWSVGGLETILLTASEFHLTSTLFGVTLRRRNTPTSQIRNLRFTPSYQSGRNRTPSRIAFEDAHGTVKFASGIEDADAIATINAMLAVYPFPKQDPALAYMGSVPVR